MPPEIRALIEQKSATIRGACDELAALGEVASESSPFRRARERLIQLIVEAVADLCHELAVAAGASPPGSTRAAIEEARRLSRIPEAPALNFERRYVSLRNRIVHDYDQLDAAVLRRESSRLIEDARVLVAAVVSEGDAE